MASKRYRYSVYRVATKLPGNMIIRPTSAESAIKQF